VPAPTGARRPAVFLDRDGVLNRAVVVDGTPRAPRSAAELEVIPSAVEACAQLRAAGYVLVVVTNQPDVARGTDTLESVEAINREVGRQTGVHEFEVCFHDDADDCDCRKPRPGMLTRATARLDLDLARSFMVGDRWRDVEAGQRAGCGTVFVDRRYSERQPDRPDVVVGELVEAVPRMIAANVLAEEGSTTDA
jgi:D-glycero-D-manno-heptose 1,7-bisphosphate phosphatase